MLVILFMNVMAPFIDYVTVQAHLRRRGKRRAQT
jgi:Na+-transporting NADH:ubiquinone oxidoreductase subunit NqrB